MYMSVFEWVCFLSPAPIFQPLLALTSPRKFANNFITFSFVDTSALISSLHRKNEGFGFIIKNMFNIIEKCKLVR